MRLRLSISILLITIAAAPGFLRAGDAALPRSHSSHPASPLATQDDGGEPPQPQKPAEKKPAEEKPAEKEPAEKEPQKPPAKPALPERCGVSWYTPEAGATEAAKARKPQLVVVPGGEGDGYWKQLASLLEHRSVQKVLGHFVAVDASPESPGLAQLEHSLGSLQNRQMIVVIDFEGRLLARWKDDVPRRRVFLKGLRQAAKSNDELATTHRSVEQELAKARYALKLKEYRQAVLHVLAAKKPALPPESDLMAQVRDVQKGIDDVYRKREDEAKELEEKRHYVAAIEKYDKMIRDFPFPERMKELRRRITHIYNLIQQP
ncbi:MAG: hypothetical protein AAF581_20065 [Planctomycetota bacterium]